MWRCVLGLSMRGRRSAFDVYERHGLRWETIPGTTKLHRLEENLGAAAVELTPDDLREIDRAASKITVQGARYSESAQRMIDR
jgi:diketogulonate reductase-like aldo/keto reductase